jgi:phosphoglycolate phosphatase
VTRPKPDPEIFQKACQQLSLNPRRVAFFGDTVSDMTMAKKAGAGLAVGILAGGISTRSLLQEAAHIVIDNLKDVSILHNPSRPV